jgi:hypothetical protein
MILAQGMVGGLVTAAGLVLREDVMPALCLFRRSAYFGGTELGDEMQ